MPIDLLRRGHSAPGAALFDGRVADRVLVLSDRATLEDILARRRPDLLPVVQDAEVTALDPADREEVRRALVDELCELPYAGGDRRALALLELLRSI